MPSNDDEHEQIRPPTPPLDPTIAAISSRLHVPKSTVIDGDGAAGPRNKHEIEEDTLSDDDDLFAELEKDDFDMGGLREKRLEALKAQLTKVKDMRETDHGRLTEIFDEKEVIKTSANEDRCVIHFYHRNFRRCQVMDKHLELIAPRHFATRFIKVFVENVPWLVEKLQIKVLPCVICFMHGVSKDRLIGFEEIGNDDGFTTTALELRLAQSGVITSQLGKSPALRTMYGGSAGGASSGIREGSQDEDWEDDE